MVTRIRRKLLHHRAEGVKWMNSKPATRKLPTHNAKTNKKCWCDPWVKERERGGRL